MRPLRSTRIQSTPSTGEPCCLFFLKPHASSLKPRSGITLIEMLVAMAITLVMMLAVVSVFDMLGRNVADNRAILEVSSRMRHVRNRLQLDLMGVTCPTIPPADPASGLGYFEIIEGQHNDHTNRTTIPAGSLTNVDITTLGDFDDVLMFTSRSPGEPFLGRFGSNDTIKSPVAEIIWYAVETPAGQPNAGHRTIYRRALLVAPWAAAQIPAADFNLSLVDFQSKYDLSARRPGSKIMLNSLEDLTKRENRYGHNPAAYPHPLMTNYPIPLASSADPNFNRLGEDVMLSSVLAFDVRVFDPVAPLKSNAGATVGPGDLGYAGGQALNNAFGAYVDLGYAGTTVSWFSSLGSTLSGLSNLTQSRYTDSRTYDTWSRHYEYLNNGLGIDGFDNNNNGIVDDPGEMQSLPPYPFPLRGVKVRIRAYEVDSRQVREVPVIQNFLPE